ncbi:OmpA family protein [Tropicimonas sp. S265A]|uniref:OmpA family protein n=1 Tax=Tropicimonas sp. S265A TaxID=3415134 RepID=UPI003C7C1D0A
MKIITRSAIVLAAATSLSACAVYMGTDEIGAELDEGNFGNPTMNNILVQTGQRSAEASLARRFQQEVPSTINFAFDSAALTPEAQAALDEQARFIRQFPEIKFSVFGHTDLVGSPSYNRGLGQRRATAAVNYMISRGVAREQLQALVTLGETQPLVVTQDREVRNRRTVTEVSGFLPRALTELDGKYAAVIYREFVEAATFEQQIEFEDGGGAGGGEGGGEE